MILLRTERKNGKDTALICKLSAQLKSVTKMIESEVSYHKLEPSISPNRISFQTLLAFHKSTFYIPDWKNNTF